MADFPDSEDGVADLLEQVEALGAGSVFMRTPEFNIDNPDLYAAKVPFVVVSKVDGASNTQGWQQVDNIEVAMFTASRQAAKDLKKAVRAVLVRPEGVRTAAGYFDRINETSSPSEVPYEQDDARRDVSNWAVVSRIQ
jgi:hypothetical protein